MTALIHGACGVFTDAAEWSERRGQQLVEVRIPGGITPRAQSPRYTPCPAREMQRGRDSRGLFHLTSWPLHLPEVWVSSLVDPTLVHSFTRITRCSRGFPLEIDELDQMWTNQFKPSVDPIRSTSKLTCFVCALRSCPVTQIHNTEITHSCLTFVTLLQWRSINKFLITFFTQCCHVSLLTNDFETQNIFYNFKEWAYWRTVLTLTLCLRDDLRIFKHFYFITIIVLIKFPEHEQFKKNKNMSKWNSENK